MLDELSGPAREPLDDVVLELTQFPEIDLGFTKLDAPGFRVSRFVDQLRDMQKGFRWNAPAVDADAARIDFRIDQGDAQTEVGGQKGGRIAARATAHHDKLSRNHKRAGMAGTAGRAEWTGPSCRSRLSSPSCLMIIRAAPGRKAAQ